MTRRNFRTWFFIIIIIFSSFLLSCKKENNKTSSGLEKISVRMKWFFAGTMTGWFAGKEQGIYTKNGIELSITPGGPDNNAVKLVAAGTDLFGVAGADEVLMSREKGIPVVAIGVLFKESPIGFISKKDKDIISPVDWEGKTVEVSYGSNAEVQYRALIKKYNVSNIKEVPYTFNLAPFLENKVDVSVAYIMDQVITLKNRGIDLNIITCRDHGINPYGDVIITTEKNLEENFDLIRRFIAATSESHKWAISHPDEAVKALVKYTDYLNYENEIEVWRSTIPFILVDGGEKEILKMVESRWKETMDVLVEFDFLKSSVDLKKSYQNIK